MHLKKGYVQVYTGDGKGKTTAAIGLAIRALGAGLKVYICQFLKKGIYSESKALKKFNNIKINCFGRGCLIKGKPKDIDKKLASKGLKTVKNIISRNIYDIVILDEINIALKLKLIPIKDVMDILINKPKNTEIILTGRYAPKEIKDLAHLVTEMKDVRHYYGKNVKCRKGIEY